MNEQEILYDFYRARAKNGQHVQLVTDLLEDIPREVAVQYGFLPQWTAFSTDTARQQLQVGQRREMVMIIQRVLPQQFQVGFRARTIRGRGKFRPEQLLAGNIPISDAGHLHPLVEYAQARAGIIDCRSRRQIGIHQVITTDADGGCLHDRERQFLLPVKGR